MGRFKKILVNTLKVVYVTIIPFLFGKGVVNAAYKTGITDELIINATTFGILYLIFLLILAINWRWIFK